MGFEGSLDSVSFGDILNTLCRLNKEGVLTVSDEKRKKAIYFRDNGVTLIGGGQRVKLGDMLVRSGKIQPRELDNAMMEQSQTGRMLGEILVERGIATAEEIEDVIAGQIQEEICDIFFWENAHFSFHEGPPKEDFIADQTQVTLTFDVQSVLFKIADKMVEWEEIRRQIPSLSTIFMPSTEGNTEIDIPETESQENFEKVFHHLDGSNDVNDIIRLTQLSVLSVCRILVTALRQNAIRQAKFEELLAIAEEYQKKGQSQKQIRLLEQALAAKPNSEELILKIAQTYESMGGGKKAGQYYCKLGELMFMTDPKTAAKHFERAISHIPKAVVPRENLLALAENMEDHQKEMVHSKILADLYREEGNYEKAVDLCNNYLARYPNNLDFFNILVKVHTTEKDYDKAVEIYEKIASIYEENGDSQTEMEILEKALEVSPERTDIELKIAKLRRRIKWEKHRYLVLTVCILLILLFAIGGYAISYELSARQTYTNAKAFENGAKYEDAQKFYDTVIREYPWSTVIEDAENAHKRIQNRLEDEKKRRAQQLEQEKKEKVQKLTNIQNLAIQKNFDKALDDLKRFRQENPEQEWQKQCALIEKEIQDKQDKAEQDAMAEDFEKAQKYQQEGKIEEAEKIYQKWMNAKFKTDDIKEMLKKLNRNKVDSFISLNKSIFDQGLQNEKISNFKLALKLYEQIGKNVSQALQIKGISESQERDLSSINQLAEEGKKRIQEFEKEAVYELQKAQELINEGKAEDGFKAIIKVVEDERLSRTEAAYKAYLPVQIVSKPSGASIQGTKHKTPFTYAFQPKQESQVKMNLHYPGFEPSMIIISKDSPPVVSVSLKKSEYWSYNIEGAIYGRCAISGNTLIVTSHTGRIVGLNSKTGELLWKQKTSSFGDISAGVTIGYDKVYVGSHDQNLYCIDMISGVMDWKFQTDGFIKILPAVDNENVFFGTTNGVFCSLNRTSGDQIWEYKSRSSIDFSPILIDQFVIFGNRRGQLTSLNVGNGLKNWVYEFNNAITSNLAIGGKNLFFSTNSGILYCFNLEDKEIIWQAKLQSGREGLIAIVEAYLYFVSTEGYVYQISRTKGKILWKTKLPKGIYGSPVQVEELLYVGCMDSTLYALDTKTGEIFWEGKYGTKGIRSDLLVSSSMIYVGTENGIIYAISK